MRIGIDYTAALRQRAGIGRYTRELIAALLEIGGPHEYTLFAATGGLDQHSLDLAARDDVRLRKIPLTDEWVARIWHRLRLPIPIELAAGHCDVLYCPDFALPPTLPQTRTLLTVHDLSFLHFPDHFVPKLVRYLSEIVPRSIARADRVLADSEATRTDLVKHLGTPRDKVEVLLSGVDPRFQPGPRQGERDRVCARYGIDQRPYVLSVGTLQPRKNYTNLIRAFSRLNLDTQLVIAGGRGWLYEKILVEAEKHAGRVLVLGFVDEDDLPALYRGASVFAFPSLYEGFGLPVLEAMACGVPVVCSATSSLPEVAGEAALLFDPQDVEGMTSSLARALGDDELRHQMKSRGIAQASRFAWPRAAQQLMATLESLGSG